MIDRFGLMIFYDNKKPVRNIKGHEILKRISAMKLDQQILNPQDAIISDSKWTKIFDQLYPDVG